MSEAAQDSDRRQRLWHRLVGAAVLAALAVILVPMLVDFSDDDGATITRSNIPERPSGFRVEEIALMPPAGTTADPAAESRPESLPAPAATTTSSSASPAPPAAAGGPPLSGFAVQLGSFSSEDNATAMRDRLRGKGYSAFLDRATIDGRTVYRVLVGPDARREHSERLRDRLAAEMDLRGVVITYE